jgi:acetyl esterase
VSYPEPELEPAAMRFASQTAEPPFLLDLSVEQARKIVQAVQSGNVPRPAATVEDWAIPGGPSGAVPVRIVRPAGARGVLPVLLYLHGSCWVYGDELTHDRLVRELATRSGAAVVFPCYSRSPEARYPVAIEECYSTLLWVVSRGEEHGLDPRRIAIAGDSVGGNMAAAVTLMTKQRSGPALTAQVLFYPVTDAAFDTESYHRFATGYWLRRDAMQWFWDQYTTDETERAQITASPLRASTGELAGLPPALVIVAEADVLRDEGEAYAAKLRAAGVPVTAVRYRGVVHDFVMVDAMRDTFAAKAATAQAGRFLYQALHAEKAGEASHADVYGDVVKQPA